MFTATGDDAKVFFLRECGGHKFQRVSPTERNGRVHSSTITVAVLDAVKNEQVEVNPSDLEWKFTRGSGKGGQNRNKLDTAAILTHVPSGVQVRCESERSQYKNKEIALKWLTEKLRNRQNNAKHNETNEIRRNFIGGGQSGDKHRTVRVRDNIVTNHLNGRKISYDEYKSGNFDGLF